jgi:hypothetical protein
MNKIIFVLLIFSCPLFAQKQDNTWVIGHDYNFNDDEHGRIVLSFVTSPPQIEYHIGDVNMNMYISNASISDSTGNLLFYSNGCNIANENGEILENGSDINPGVFHDQLCDVIGRGYGGGYPNSVILQLPENDSIFYLFHGSIIYIPPPQGDAYVDRLLHSIVTISNNNKYVSEKNTPLLLDSLAGGEMNAVKHANGKDWWIIQPRRNSNQFYIFYFTKDGIVDTLTQTIGAPSPANKEGYGQTAFSPLGDKMVRYYPDNDIRLYQFDRASGFFTDYSTFELNVGNTIAFDGGCAFSPSGQYLYIAALTNIYQFDMTAADISATQTTVATWDGFVDPIAIAFWHCQLGPDCKIYSVGGGDTRYYHIIHNPDEQGLACNVEQRGLVLPTPSGASIPYFPNYRLGPIDNPGLPCSPIVATQQPALSVAACSVWPNPASEQLHFALTGGNNIRRIALTDAYGRVLRDLRLSGASDQYTMSLAGLPGGVYFWVLEGDKGGGSAKVVVQGH